MKKFVLLLFLFSLFVQVAYACLCDFGLFEDRVRELPFIFKGRVLSVEDIYADSTSKWPVEQNIIIAVEKKFKGNQNDTLTVHSNLNSCSSFFEEGGEYLVFAMHLINTETNIDQEFINKNDKVVTGQCYGTREVENAKSDIQLLEKLFSSKYLIEDISADQLYNEIWKEESFTFTDELPAFPSGLDSLNTFIQKNLNSCSLPDERPNSTWDTEINIDSLYKELNIDYKPRKPTFVWVQFDISKTGELNNFMLNENFSLNKECNEEALRVAKLMPDWNPAKIKGIPVNSSHWIEIDFDRKSAY